MRRIVVALVGTVAGLVGLFSYHTSLAGAGSVTTAPALGASTAPTATGGSSAGGSSAGGSSAGGPSTGGSSTGGSRTVTGAVAQTRWGPVQVRLKVSGGKITAADAVQYPNGNGRDQQINSYALPVLAREVLAAQNANIDLVSGATVTSDGYVTSLQSAIDKAHL
ncbi:MAG TPA: FMN-binding protein [Actinomycetes bacterium]|nr:FMN-binding protein [Actinomycetes bacterium]